MQRATCNFQMHRPGNRVSSVRVTIIPADHNLNPDPVAVVLGLAVVDPEEVAEEEDNFFYDMDFANKKIKQLYYYDFKKDLSAH